MPAVPEEVWLFVLRCVLTYPSSFPLAVPGAPPRKVEVEAVNSTAIRVTWKPPLTVKQHGQIRGYQVIFSRLENGEPVGQPNILDVALPEAQVRLRPQPPPPKPRPLSAL